MANLYRAIVKITDGEVVTVETAYNSNTSMSAAQTAIEADISNSAVTEIAQVATDAADEYPHLV